MLLFCIVMKTIQENKLPVAFPQKDAWMDGRELSALILLARGVGKEDLEKQVASFQSPRAIALGQALLSRERGEVLSPDMQQALDDLNEMAGN